jgi:hypothetical protein
MCTEEQGWAALDKGCEMLKAEIHAKVRLTLLVLLAATGFDVLSRFFCH